jgi:hypothetical protein
VEPYNLEEAERLIDQQIATARRRGSISEYAAAMTMPAYPSDQDVFREVTIGVTGAGVAATLSLCR